MTEKNGKIYEFEDFRLDLAEQILSRAGKPVALTPKVFDLLAVLVENHGHLLSKDELVKTLWADSFVEEANLNVTVSALRKILGEKPQEDRFIETVPRRGYRFVAKVREILDDDADENFFETGQAFTEAKTLSIENPAKNCPKCKNVYYDKTLNFCLDDGETLVLETRPTKKSLSTPFQTHSKLFLLLGAILISAAVGIFIWKFAFQTEVTEVSNIKTLAVLPFKPLAGDQSDSALEIGMADALITKLSSIRQITVRPTSAVSKYSEAKTDPLIAGKELQVEAVLDGKIQRARNKIRVTVQLLRVSDGATLWAESFDDFFTNIFAVQDSISEKMTSRLALKLSGNEKEQIAKRFTENTEAYAFYLKGRFYHEKITVEGSRKAVEFYEQAVQKDPEYALAYAWTTGALLHLANIGEDREENLRKARMTAFKAAELDPNLPDARESLANIYDVVDWKFAEAEIEYKKAIELDQNNPDAHFAYATFLSRFKNRQDEALREIEFAKRLNPVAMYMQTQAIYILLRMRRNDEAIREAKKIVELNPDFQQTYYLLAKLFTYQSMPAEANDALKKYLEITKERGQFLTAFVYRNSGKKAEAETILRELAGQYKDGDNCDKYALFYVLLGENNRAFEFLEKSFQRREVTMLTLDVDPDWDEIRSDPRFQDLVRRIGLQQ